MLSEARISEITRAIAKVNDFVIDKCIHVGLYYKTNNVRDIIFSGEWQGLSSVIKVYNDVRFRADGLSQRAFNEHNKSKILLAPKVYKYEIESPTHGWLIMEKLPEDGLFLKSPLLLEQRKDFLDLFLEYKSNSSSKPARPLSLLEKMSASEYHSIRISRWFELATQAEMERLMRKEKPLLDDNFINLYLKAMSAIRKEFSNRKIEWCAHGHFVPNQIYKLKGKNLYYLTDFGHAKMYPEGYEWAFLIWSDWIMHVDWEMPYREWRKGICDWCDTIKEYVVDRLEINNFRALIFASLLERLIGAALADITATDQMPRKEQEERLSYICRAIENFTDTYSAVCDKLWDFY